MNTWLTIDGSFEECTDACPECGNAELFGYKSVNNHIGAYCVFCGKWVTWVRQWNDENWKKAVKEKAQYICERCSNPLNPREAVAHHKVPKWFKPEWKFDLSNGMCLCRNCHKQIHGKGGTIKEKENEQ